MGFIGRILKEAAKLILFESGRRVIQFISGGKSDSSRSLDFSRENEIQKLREELRACKNDLERCNLERQMLEEALRQKGDQLRFTRIWAIASTIAAAILLVVLLWR